MSRVVPGCSQLSWSRAALGAALALAGCDDRPRPWSQGDGPPAVLAPRTDGTTVDGGGDAAEEGAGETVGTAPPSASPSTDIQGAPAGTRSASGTDGVTGTSSAEVASDDERGKPKVNPGGGWVKCHEGLSLSGDPVKDVTRLGLLCGPSNGMRRKTKQAIVGLVGEHEPPVVTTIQSARGACYRIFAAADAQVGELDVTVRSSRDVGVAADHGAGRLAIVQPDRPFCTFADETFTVEVSARRGSGRFAAEVWALGEPRRRRDSMESPPDETPLDKP